VEFISRKGTFYGTYREEKRKGRESMTNHLSSVLDNFERAGKLNVRARDLRSALPGISDEGLRKAVHRQQQRGRLAGISRGSEHWLIVPLQHAAMGAPPLESWLHQYMNKTLTTPYYVAMLSAAEVYGASPYAVMVTQVMVTQVMVPERRRAITVGRHRVEFHTRARLEEMPTQWHETPDGGFKISTPELTVLDIIQHESMLGGIARVQEVLRGLWMHCSQDAIIETLDTMENVSLAQRLGALMELDGKDGLSPSVECWLDGRALRLVHLGGTRELGDNALAAAPIDERFKVLIPADLKDANA
jgi:predicted transcriptional regulator of viral defense system